MNRYWDFIKDVIQHFYDSNTFEKGGALAYYSIFAFLPILVIISAVLGFVFGEQAAQGDVFQELKGFFGKETASQIQIFIQSQYVSDTSVLVTVIGSIFLIFSATAVFYQLQSSLNNIWFIQPKPESSKLKYVLSRIISFIIIIILGFVVLLSSTINSFFYKFSEYLSNSAYFSKVPFLLELLISLFLLSILFTMMFKYLGDAIVHWKCAIVGGLFTTFFFTVGKLLISLYIGKSSVLTMFGSASIIAILLVWVYYNSQIIFLGAIFTYQWGKRNNYHILPDKTSTSTIIK